VFTPQGSVVSDPPELAESAVLLSSSLAVEVDTPSPVSLGAVLLESAPDVDASLPASPSSPHPNNRIHSTLALFRIGKLLLVMRW